MIFRHASLFLALALLAAATAQQFDFEVIEVAYVSETDDGEYLTTMDGDEPTMPPTKPPKPPELWEIYPDICTVCKHLLQDGKNSTDKPGKACKKDAKTQIKKTYENKQLRKAVFNEFKPECKDRKSDWKTWFKSGECQDDKHPEKCKPNEMCHKAKFCPKPENDENRNDPDDCTVSGEVCHCCLDIVRASKDYADESEEDADALDFCKDIVQGNLSVGEDGDEDGDEDEEDQCVYDSFRNSDCRDWFGSDAESTKPKDLCVDTGYCTCSMSNSKSRRRKLGRAEPVYD